MVIASSWMMRGAPRPRFCACAVLDSATSATVAAKSVAARVFMWASLMLRWCSVCRTCVRRGSGCGRAAAGRAAARRAAAGRRGGTASACVRGTRGTLGVARGARGLALQALLLAVDLLREVDEVLLRRVVVRQRRAGLVAVR